MLKQLSIIKYKIILYNFLIFYFFISCNNISKHKNKIVKKHNYTINDLSESRIVHLKEAFEKKKYLEFFRFFPNTYEELINFYGYDYDTGAKPLYEDSYEQINYLFEYHRKIDLDIFIKKIYKISIGGSWEADAVSYFQDGLCELIINYPEYILNNLKNKEEKEMRSFWFFVFDGPCKNDKKFEIIYDTINKIDVSQSFLLKEEYKKIY